MPAIEQTISRIMPEGSNPGESDLRRVPLWPPDLFAVTAHLARLSECYTLAAVRGGMGLGRGHARQCCNIGTAWANFDPSVEGWLQERWDVVTGAKALPLEALREVRNIPLVRALFELMAAADEACDGVGFGGASAVAIRARAVASRNRGGTLCTRVAADEVCVQPKACAPTVGCNLRSMSHHLALLPASSQVFTQHFEARDPLGDENGRVGVLIVPYPYRIQTEDFRTHQRIPSQAWARLKLGFSWHGIDASDLVDFVNRLVVEAQGEGRSTDVVVLPELALSAEMWKTLTAGVVGPRLLVAGVLGETTDATHPAKNLARGFLTDLDDFEWEQAKHHRWRIERYQVSNYGLEHLRPDNFPPGGDVFNDPSWQKWYGWWEDIDIQDRRVVTTRFGDAASIATLICEDLSRVDPVQPVLRELGPTWVIALLMDGPQYERRWAAQGAGALADDPGSSVLVVTSLGLVQRNRDHREGRRGSSHAAVGLWRDAGGAMQVLELPASAHALHLRARLRSDRVLTLDGRSDRRGTRRLELADSAPISDPAPPSWAERFRPS